MDTRKAIYRRSHLGGYPWWIQGMVSVGQRDKLRSHMGTRCCNLSLTWYITWMKILKNQRKAQGFWNRIDKAKTCVLRLPKTEFWSRLDCRKFRIQGIEKPLGLRWRYSHLAKKGFPGRCWIFPEIYFLAFKKIGMTDSAILLSLKTWASTFMLLKPEAREAGWNRGNKKVGDACWKEARGHLLEVWVCLCTRSFWPSLVQLETLSCSILLSRWGFKLNREVRIDYI